MLYEQNGIQRGVVGTSYIEDKNITLDYCTKELLDNGQNVYIANHSHPGADATSIISDGDDIVLKKYLQLFPSFSMNIFIKRGDKMDYVPIAIDRVGVLDEITVTAPLKNNNMKSLLFIIVLLLSSLSVFGQLGRNALPGGLESYTVYETNSPSFQKILEFVSVQEPEIIKWWIYKDGFSVDKVIKRWNFERKMFKDYAIEIMRVDSVLLLQISEYSGYGELDRSRYDMEPLIVLEQNGAHFFFTPTGFNSNNEQK